MTPTWANVKIAFLVLCAALLVKACAGKVWASSTDAFGGPIPETQPLDDTPADIDTGWPQCPDGHDAELRYQRDAGFIGFYCDGRPIEPLDGLSPRWHYVHPRKTDPKSWRGR